VLGVGVVGAAGLGSAVVGVAVLGTAVLGVAVLGAAVLGTAVLGVAVLGVAVGVTHSELAATSVAPHAVQTAFLLQSESAVVESKAAPNAVVLSTFHAARFTLKAEALKSKYVMS
jgi:hypothetical protein